MTFIERENVASPGFYSRLSDACKRSGVPFLLIDQGYGPARIAEAFRARRGREPLRGG